MFRTELSLAPDANQLPRTARVLTVGSCFADSIGARLAAHKVETLVNPFGTVFQPLALGRLLRAAAGEDVDWQQHVVEARGRWQSYDLHGSIGADSPVALLQTIQELVRRTGEFVRNADVVLLTLGTAWAYRLRETGELVNNCHKQPADLFVRELLTPDDVINGLAETHAYLRRINPKLRFVLTVSPVRHLKDTLPLSAVSKSVLRVAAHFVSELLPDTAYFPAYELVLDDLRDYRFYAADMLHPSEVAEDYVWDRFARTYFDAEFGRFRKEWTGVRQALGHRPLHPGAPEHRQFLESTLGQLEQLSLRRVPVAEELREVRTQLAALPVPGRLAPPLEADDEERVDLGVEPANVAETAPEGQVLARPAAAPLPAAEGRAPRLSPEEFRAQRAAQPSRPERGRREGRGKKGQVSAAENEQFQGAAADSQPETPSFIVPAPLVAATQPEELTVASGRTGEEALGGEEALKKKKRRSRGGVKRTARKNALRLAGGEGSPEPGANAAPAAQGADLAVDTAGANAQVAGREAPPGAKPGPGRRDERRESPGRVPQTALFAASEPAPNLLASATTAATGAPADHTSLPPTEPATASVNARNGRNRNGRGKNRTATEAPNMETPGAAPASDATTRQAKTGAGAAAPGSPKPLAAQAAGEESGRREPVTAVAASPAAPRKQVATAEPTAAETRPVATPAARQSTRAKRLVSAARAEKPAVDTPVVPVPDALQARTQVAAGRMTGSSASLVAPVALVALVAKKAVSSKQAGVPKKAVVARVPVTPAAPAAAAKLQKAPRPVAKPKAVAKPKVARAKADPVKAPAVEPVIAKVAPKKAVSAKSTGSKPTPKSAAAKPAASKKPAKPAQ